MAQVQESEIGDSGFLQGNSTSTEDPSDLTNDFKDINNRIILYANTLIYDIFG